MNLRVVLCALLLASPVAAQSVQQSGTVTRGHVAVWNTSGVIADGGSSASSPISSIGVTNNGGAGICVNSALPTSPGWNSLCLGAATSGPAVISLQNFGTASVESIVFDINGSTQGFPTVTPLPVVIGNIACFSNTSGALTDCGSAPSTVPLVVGTTPIGNGTSGAPLFDNSGILGNGSVSSIWSAFTQAGTNAVTRTVQNKLQDWLSVADFATPQDAINQAIATNGNTIWWPCGTYTLSTSLSFQNAGFPLRMTGPSGAFGGPASKCMQIISSANPVIAANSNSAVEIDHLYIVGTASGGQTLIDLSHGSSAADTEAPNIHDNLISAFLSNSGNIGIDIDEAESSVITHNFIGINGGTGISGVRTTGHYSIQAVISKNIFSSGNATALFAPGETFSFFGNTVEGNEAVITPGAAGTCKDLTVTGNWIGDYSSAGATFIDSNCTALFSSGNRYANGGSGGISIKQENGTGTVTSISDQFEGVTGIAIGTGNGLVLQTPNIASLTGSLVTGTPATTNPVQYVYGSSLMGGPVTFGVAGSIVGQAVFANATSGTITLEAPTGALGTTTLFLPDSTDTLAAVAASQTLTNKTISGTSNTLSNIGNGSLTNSTISGVALGSNLNSLAFGTHLVSGGTSYNGSAGVTITSDATAVNTASTIMARDGSGQVAATTFTGALTGHGSLDLALTGGTMSGNIAMGGNQINNVIIGTTTPLAGAFTTLTATTLANVATTSALCYNVGTGALTYDGTIGTCTVSDERLKNMGPRIDHALDKLLRINGVSYTWKDPARGSGPQIGVGAQTVEKVFPELVQTGSDGIKSVDYQRLTAPIIEALRELKADNDDLKTEMKKLKHGFHQHPL